MAMQRLVILACSATKRSDPGYIPAIERYDGPLWQTLRAARAEAAPVACAFVSARYGFGCDYRPIENYNERMTPEKARAMIEGGLGTRWPRPPSWKHPDNYGVHAATEMAGLTEYGARPFVDVAIVGGELYLEVMRGFVEQFRAAGYVTPDARITVINAPIGYMRQQLREWMHKGKTSPDVSQVTSVTRATETPKAAVRGIRISPAQKAALDTAGVFELDEGDREELVTVRAAIEGDGIAPSLEVWRALNELANAADELGRDVGRDHKDAAMYRADSRSLTALACKVLREARRIEAAKPAIKPPSLTKLKKQCREWSAANPAYSDVIYSKPGGERMPTKIRGKARVLRDRRLVVSIYGQSACVPLESIERPASEFATTRVIRNRHGRYFTGGHTFKGRPKFTAKRSEALEMSDERSSRELRIMDDESMRFETVPAMSAWRALNPPDEVKFKYWNLVSEARGVVTRFRSYACKRSKMSPLSTE